MHWMAVTSGTMDGSYVCVCHVRELLLGVEVCAVHGTAELPEVTMRQAGSTSYSMNSTTDYP